MTKQFKQVDVFTNQKFKGNPVAVFFDADDLSSQQMLQMANWTNLSETTFVLKPTVPEASYKLRIFTPAGELPFAGHPTIGSCFALLELSLIRPNNKGNFIQECEAGLVELSPLGNLNDLASIQLMFKLPYYKFKELVNPNVQLEEIAEALGNISVASIITTPILVDDGPKWLVVQLRSKQEVLDLIPNLEYLKKISSKYEWIGLCVFGKDLNSDNVFEIRNFAPIVGCLEDPACGSGAGSVGAYLAAKLKTNHTELQLYQGKRILRDAKLLVKIKKNEGITIHVAGQAVTCIDGLY